MKKIFKICGIIMGVIVLILSIILLKVFVIGHIQRVDTISVEKISIEENKVTLIAFPLGDSAAAFKNYTYVKKGNDLYIEIHCVLVSNIHRYGNIDIEINGDFSDVKTIYLKDENESKIILAR